MVLPIPGQVAKLKAAEKFSLKLIKSCYGEWHASFGILIKLATITALLK